MNVLRSYSLDAKRLSRDSVSQLEVLKSSLKRQAPQARLELTTALIRSQVLCPLSYWGACRGDYTALVLAVNASSRKSGDIVVIIGRSR